MLTPNGMLTLELAILLNFVAGAWIFAGAVYEHRKANIYAPAQVCCVRITALAPVAAALVWTQMVCINNAEGGAPMLVATMEALRDFVECYCVFCFWVLMIVWVGGERRATDLLDAQLETTTTTTAAAAAAGTKTSAADSSERASAPAPAASKSANGAASASAVNAKLAPSAPSSSTAPSSTKPCNRSASEDVEAATAAMAASAASPYCHVFPPLEGVQSLRSLALFKFHSGSERLRYWRSVLVAWLFVRPMLTLLHAARVERLVLAQDEGVQKRPRIAVMIVTAVAMHTLLDTYWRLRSRLDGLQTARKFVAIKVVVGVTILQQQLAPFFLPSGQRGHALLCGLTALELGAFSLLLRASFAPNTLNMSAISHSATDDASGSGLSTPRLLSLWDVFNLKSISRKLYSL